MRKTCELSFWIFMVSALMVKCKPSAGSVVQNVVDSKNLLGCNFDTSAPENKGFMTTKPFTMQGSYSYSTRWNDADDINKPQKDAPNFNLLITYQTAKSKDAKSKKADPWKLNIDLTAMTPKPVASGFVYDWINTPSGTRWRAFVNNDRKISNLFAGSGKAAAGLYIDRIEIQNDKNLFGINEYKVSNTVVVKCTKPADANHSFDGKICPDQSIKAPYPTLAINFTRNALPNSGRYEFRIKHADGTAAQTTTDKDWDEISNLGAGTNQTTLEFTIKKSGLYSIDVKRYDDKNPINRADEQFFAEAPVCPGPLTLGGIITTDLDPNKSTGKKYKATINEGDKDDVVVGAGEVARSKKKRLCDTIANLNKLKNECIVRSNLACNIRPLILNYETNKSAQIGCNYRDSIAGKKSGCYFDSQAWETYVYSYSGFNDINVEVESANCEQQPNTAE